MKLQAVQSERRIIMTDAASFPRCSSEPSTRLGRYRWHQPQVLVAFDTYIYHTRSWLYWQHSRENTITLRSIQRNKRSNHHIRNFLNAGTASRWLSKSPYWHGRTNMTAFSCNWYQDRLTSLWWLVRYYMLPKLVTIGEEVITTRGINPFLFSFTAVCRRYGSFVYSMCVFYSMTGYCYRYPYTASCYI